MNKNTTYKPTGNKWIPQIPEHWEILKAKHLGNFQGSTVDKKSVKGEKKIRMLNFTDVYGNQNLSVKEDIDFMQLTARDNQIRDFKLNVGDMVFTPSSEISEDIGQSALIEYEADDLLFSYHLIRLSFTRKVNHNFKKYLFNNRPTLKYFSKVCKGSTRKILNRIDFKNIPIFLPPYDEQGRIAKYLDHKTTEIQNFIAKKQNLINLLKEQRQAIINDAVTKGINPDVEIKDSGVAWLGHIPKHWEVRKLKHCLKSKLKYGANEAGIPFDSSLYRYVRITDFNISGELDEQNKLSLPIEKGKDYELKNGDILFARSGATVGKTFQFKKDDENMKYCYAGYLIKAEADEGIVLSDYLYNFTNSIVFENWKNISFSKATIENVGANKYAQLFITIPTIAEQKQILNFIKSETKNIDSVISKTQKEIDLIKEYKEALITEAVTGKITIS